MGDCQNASECVSYGGMLTFKPAAADLPKLQAAVTTLKQGNKKVSEGQKETEASKALITEWLKKERGCDVGTLSIGDVVLIDGTVMVEIAAMIKLDANALLASEPSVHQKYTRSVAVRKFKPLI